MSQTLLPRVVSLALSVVVVASRLDAADGFRPLFNGVDLSGWESVNCPPETFTVRDGMIVSTGVPTGFMHTDRQYENFILELEWRHMVPKGNAGVFVWGHPLPAIGTPFARGIEVQILDGRNTENYTSHGDVFAIQGATMKPDRPHPNGWMRCLPSERRAKPTGQWNHYRITCRDGVVKLAVNGKEVSGGSECNPRKGYICLESEGSEAHFRNIRIKGLPSSDPPPAPELVAPLDAGFEMLYSGLDLRGWKSDPGHAGHWQSKNWRLSYDGKSEAEDKNLWTEESFEDFILICDWRLPGKPEKTPRAVILPSGEYVLDENGEQKTVEVDDAGDSGIYLRGSSKSQVNIWCWPIGSGEVYGYRNDESVSAEVRRGVTPRVKADNPLGKWNRFIIKMVGDRLTVDLNGTRVLDNARLPGVAKAGPIALQHHGDRVEFANIFIKRLPRRTALDDYIEKPDPSYSWKLVDTREGDGVTTSLLEMTSQNWRTSEEVDRTEWKHWLVVSKPDEVATDACLLTIGGGRNGRSAPRIEKGLAIEMARASKCVVAELRMIPNQPLRFLDDPDARDRVEDDLVAYTWNKYMDTGDPTWVARMPMVKASVRAMDTIQAFMKGKADGRSIERFVVAGGSKRGWTTWLTGAVDTRVVALIPIVIDVVNVIPSMEHHHAAYGFWAPAIGDYVRNGVIDRRESPEYKKLIELVDPYYYMHRLTVPKYIVNASGDQFFLPDSSRFYFDDLSGEKHLRYVPNADHSLKGSDAAITIQTFFASIAHGIPRPRYSWDLADDGSIRVRSESSPKRVVLWQAHNPEARDFRLESVGQIWTSSELEADEDGVWVARVGEPEKGWRAFFVELTFDSGGPAPFVFTTPVRVVPDTLPFAGKLGAGKRK